MAAREPMRVLHVSQATTAGVPNVVLSLVADQVSRGWEVTVACPPDGYLAARSRDLGASVITWAASREPGLSVPAEALRLRKVISMVRPELIHLHSAKAGLVGRLVIRRAVPTVFQPHAWSFHAVSGATKRASVLWERWSARWADVIVAVSTDERREGINTGIDGRFMVVPNGVDVSTTPPSDPSDARRRLGLPDVPTVVCVGRLCRQKGQDRLLSAWPSVLASVPSAQLVLVGDGPDRCVLTEQAQGLEAVTFAGDRSDVASWLVAADVVALPSRWEAGLSLVAMEAMATRRSIVAADVAGVRAGLDGGAGEVVRQGDLPGLAAAIVARLVSPSAAAEEGRLGRLTVEARFDRAASTRAMATLYGQVVSGKLGHRPSGGGHHPHR